jgi:hypothetical protein
MQAKIKPPADTNDSSHIKSHDEPCRRPKQQNQQPNYQTKPPPMRKIHKRPRRRNIVALLPCGRRYSHCDRFHRSVHRPGGDVRTTISRPQRRPRQPHRYERMERGDLRSMCLITRGGRYCRCHRHGGDGDVPRGIFRHGELCLCGVDKVRRGIYVNLYAIKAGKISP